MSQEKYFLRGEGGGTGVKKFLSLLSLNEGDRYVENSHFYLPVLSRQTFVL